MASWRTMDVKETMKKNIAKRFKPYPAYKDSGVEWLDEIPEGWRVKPVFAMYKRSKRINNPEEELLSVYRDYGVIPTSSRDDNFNKPSEDLSTYQLVKPRDLVINKMKAWQGSIAVSELTGIVSPAYHVYLAHHDENDRYIHYLMRSPIYASTFLRFSKGIRVNQWDLEPESFSHLHILLPTNLEQYFIITYLDREATRIDALLTKYQILLDLLKEKRSALISKAVTKGLDPNVPMRDSGVEWLGKIAQAWNVRRIKYIIHLNPRSLSENTNPNYIFQYIDIGSVDNKGSYLPSQEISFESAPSRARRVISEGDIIISTVRTYLRAIALIKKNDIPQVASTGFAVLRCKDYIEPRFLQFALSAPYFIDKVVANSEGIGYPSINESLMSSFNIVYPSIKEQIAIVDFLNCETAKIDSLVAKVERAVELLKEYRVALISAAVTGKIDLREESA